MRTLVLGCDASGKSTLLNSIQKNYGDHLVESTSTPESRAFKLASLDTPVDEEYIGRRETLYLKLSRDILSRASSSGVSYVSTDATLVTRVSHDVMRRAISLPGRNNIDLVRAWQSDEQELSIGAPDIIAFMHAPFGVIKQRISARQQNGQPEEKFWGFNSPFFLEAYQERWLDMTADLGRLGFRCLTLDSSLVSPEDQLAAYDEVRQRYTASGCLVEAV